MGEKCLKRFKKDIKSNNSSAFFPAIVALLQLLIIASIYIFTSNELKGEFACGNAGLDFLYLEQRREHFLKESLSVCCHTLSN